MSLSTNQSIIRGRFTSDGASKTIAVPWLPSRVELLNITQFGSTAGATPVITAEWREGMPDNSVITGLKTNGSATIAIPAMNTSEGVRLIDGSSQSPGTAVSGGTITRGATTTVDQTAHGLNVGDTVRLTSTTGMLQIAGMEFTVATVPTADQFTIATLDSSGFAADATAVTSRFVPFTTYYPRYMWITDISQAAQAVIQLSMTGTDLFAVNQEITLRVPEVWGMVEADNKQARVLSVDNANGTITVDLDTSGFTAFAFPTSATAAAGITFPQVIPFGNVSGSPTVNPLFNQSRFQIILGTNAIGGNNDVMEWVATRALEVTSTAL